MAEIILAGQTFRLTHHAMLKRHRFEAFAKVDDSFVYAGGVTAYRTASHIVIHDLFITEAYRRKGLARTLLGAAVKARKRCSSSLKVYADNHGAIALYTSLGFVERKREGLKQPLLTMFRQHQ